MRLRAAVRQVLIAPKFRTRDRLVTATHPERQTHPDGQPVRPLRRQSARRAGDDACRKNSRRARRPVPRRPADIEDAAIPALRHRIILNFEGEAEGTSSDDVIAEVLKLRAA